MAIINDIKYFLGLTFCIPLCHYAQTNSSSQTNPANILGVGNIAIGMDVMTASESSSFNNIGIGYRALRQQRTGNNNTAVGHFAMENNFIGVSNTAFGKEALRSMTGQGFNVAFGESALGRAEGFGSYNTAFGVRALQLNFDGNYNVAVGVAALALNTNGFRNVAVGNYALYDNIAGGYNVAVGASSLQNNLANMNTAFGRQTMLLNRVGLENVVMGNGALHDNLNGSRNVAIGYQAGKASTGIGNVYLGYMAGYNNKGHYQLFISNPLGTIVHGDFSTRQVLLGVGHPDVYSFAGTRTLNVRQGILTDSLRIASVADWPDHVFDNDHELIPLPDLDNYLRRERHLPGIPTQGQVKEIGVELGKMQSDLLKKVEELTLYLLQISEVRNTLKQKMHTVQDEHKAMDAMVGELMNEIKILEKNL
ncbi:MAG TPA: hypothetical protein VK907_09195 [Phnomibacter sp.]|nr:hypothetical protein [Phnomibacter sp.]